MITKIYMIRHAEAEGNLYRRVHGQYDSLNTELGMRQIHALSERFSALPVDAVYSSDLVRAVTTAQAISVPRELDILTTPKLREVGMGRWEDLTWAHLEQHEAQQLQFFNQDPVRWNIGDNEPHQALGHRMVEAVMDITKHAAGQTVCVVSHGHAIRTLLAHILELPSERYGELPHLDNTAVTLLEVHDGQDLTVRWMNDASHLEGGLSTLARQSWWRSEGAETGNADFLPLDIDQNERRYLSYRQEAWGEVHGTLAGFTDEYLDLARAHVHAHPLALVEGVISGTPFGLLELNPQKGAAEKSGHISFYYVAPGFREQGVGIQLLGHAISVYRPLGRENITVHVAETNTAAIRFYERFGFQKIGETEGVRCPLWVMALDIRVRVREL
ncbi:MAG: bifunctional histidine phosphatase family protein/GNAT family N-acetyltransferase [Oscillospiraceae bacterium]|nr:bifunctional histidine phosphatase family protein/GNAT family N-acetyltransferase [Oscillospiraceae bacterium]